MNIESPYTAPMPPYEVRRSKRARALRLSVYADGAVVVTAPTLFSLRAIERYVTAHSTWVHRKLEEYRGRTVVYVRRADIPRLKREALARAEDRVRHFAALYGVTYGKISIRAQKTRWGSCSRDGNLSFNYRLAALSPALVDYVVVHEICHRIAFDHSRVFWQAVEATIPNHRALRKELREIAFLYS